ncbi:MAG: hypothetical protein ACLRMJ_04510 [Alistipes finegoldii]
MRSLLGGWRSGDAPQTQAQQGRRAAAQIPAYRHAHLSAAKETPRFPLPPCGARRLLIETVGRLVARPTADPPLRASSAVRLTVAVRRIRLRRVPPARYLICSPPARRNASARSRPLMRSRNRYVRFYALMTRLAAEPATSLRRMAEYDYPFRPAKWEIMAILRRGCCRSPTNRSSAPSRNLRMVGLASCGSSASRRRRGFCWHGPGVPELGAKRSIRSADARSLRRRGWRVACLPAGAQGAAALHRGGLSLPAAAVARRPERPYYESLIHPINESCMLIVQPLRCCRCLPAPRARRRAANKRLRWQGPRVATTPRRHRICCAAAVRRAGRKPAGRICATR